MNIFIYYLKRVYDVFFLPSKAKSECKSFLKNGRYIIDNNYTVLRLIDGQNKNVKIKTFSDPNEINEKSFNSFLRRILSNRKINIKTSKDKKKFNGSCLIISSSGKQYKIFDYESKRILTKYNNIKQFKKCINNYNYLKTIYNMPSILEINNNELYTIEEMILPTISNCLDTFNYLLNNINKNFDKYFKYDVSDIVDRGILNDSTFIKLKDIHNELSDSIIFVKCHGDLWDANILNHYEDYYIIDVESSKKYIFYYDLFFYIFSQAYYQKNEELLINYLDGKYDDKLRKVFILFNCKYDDKLRSEYFISFLYEFIFDRHIDCNNYSSRIEYNKIKKFINKYRLLGDIDE